MFVKSHIIGVLICLKEKREQVCLNDNLTQVNYETLSDKKIPHLLAMFSWFTRLFLPQDSQNQISSPINTFPCFIGAPIVGMLFEKIE
ncbi:unnamed protein product [Trifolium pratense]|uniref:Uncharacterized protein n=2 Tax=Trifolium pratense TaxID=57577 RepID=A0ACB0INY4_TRIPR|nr:unnamed protein product [Trifolium pratense]CAJ2633705.1 unnamed protein product [Trifolium pratense]